MMQTRLSGGFLFGGYRWEKLPCANFARVLHDKWGLNFAYRAGAGVGWAGLRFGSKS